MHHKPHCTGKNIITSTSFSASTMQSTNDRQLMPAINYYGAMVCIAWTVLSQDIRPSVCLSHTTIVSKRLSISSNFFLPPGSHSILVFNTKLYDNIPTGTPLKGALNAEGMKKIVIFD